MTGIHNSRGTFSLTGSTTEQSTLTINGGLAGVVAKNKTTIKDSSLHVNLSWDKAPQDKWGTPIQNNGLMALGAIGNDLSLLNTASEGKSLTITTKNVDVVGQKTSGLLSLMQGNLSIENFAAINVNVSNPSGTAYGLRAVSGNITAENGITDIQISTENGTSVYSSSYDGQQNGDIKMASDNLVLQATGENGVAIDANDNLSLIHI